MNLSSTQGFFFLLCKKLMSKNEVVLKIVAFKIFNEIGKNVTCCEWPSILWSYTFIKENAL